MFREIAYTIASIFFISGLDDLFIDFNYLFRSRRKKNYPTLEEINSVPKKKIALFIPTWREEKVIGEMLRHTLSSVDYSNYEVFVGVYPNDWATQGEVNKVVESHSIVHKVICPHDGPTNKADNLNWIYQGMLLEEKRVGKRFDIIVMHDAEDIVHPTSFKLHNYLIPTYDMVQIPVFPLEQPVRKNWVYGTYMDEFAENHTKDLLVRGDIKGILPSAGVGTGFNRQALEELAEDYQNQIFNVNNLTEDYEIGIRLSRAGKKIAFVEGVRRNKKGNKGLEYIATREFFPRRLRDVLRQKSRWVAGITMQSWEQTGWRGSLAQKYTLWRDRKASVTNLVNLLAYGVVITILAHFIALRFYNYPVLNSPLFPKYSLWWWLVVVDTTILFERMAYRFNAVNKIYGRKQAFASIPRLVVANFVNFLATLSAFKTYLGAKLTRRVIPWTKTSHAFPTEEHLREYRRKLGDLLVERRLLTESQLEEALLRQSRDRKRLGEILIELGYISEEDFVAVFSEQQGLTWVELDPYFIAPSLKELIPKEVAGKYSVLPILLLDNSLMVATPDLLGEEKLKKLEEMVHRRIELRIVTTSDFNFAFNRYYEVEEEWKGPRLGRLLLEEKLITKEELQNGFRHQKKSGKPLGEALVELKLLKEEELEEVLSRQLRSNFIDPDPRLVNIRVVEEIPEEVARRTSSIPLLLVDNTLLVVTPRPDEGLRGELERVSGKRVRFVPGSEAKIMGAIDHCYTQWQQKMEGAERLGEYLVEGGLLNSSQLEEGLAIQKRSGEKLGRILVDKKFITAEQLMEALSARWGMPYAKIELERISKELTKGVYPRRYLFKNCLIPLYLEGDKLLVAMENPIDLEALDEVRLSSKRSVVPVIATRSDIFRAINYVFKESLS